MSHLLLCIKAIDDIKVTETTPQPSPVPTSPVVVDVGVAVYQLLSEERHETPVTSGPAALAIVADAFSADFVDQEDPAGFMATLVTYAKQHNVSALLAGVSLDVSSWTPPVNYSLEEVHDPTPAPTVPRTHTGQPSMAPSPLPSAALTSLPTAMPSVLPSAPPSKGPHRCDDLASPLACGEARHWQPTVGLPDFSSTLLPSNSSSLSNETSALVEQVGDAAASGSGGLFKTVVTSPSTVHVAACRDHFGTFQPLILVLDSCPSNTSSSSPSSSSSRPVVLASSAGLASGSNGRLVVDDPVVAIINASLRASMQYSSPQEPFDLRAVRYCTTPKLLSTRSHIYSYF